MDVESALVNGDANSRSKASTARTSHATPSMGDDPSSHNRKRRSLCIWITVAVVLALTLISVILAVTVFKARRPVTTVNSVSLKDLDVSLDIPRMRVDINVSVLADISVSNPNKVGFKYDNSSAFVDYKGETVGEAPIPAGEIGAGETKPMNITLTVMADRLLSNSEVFNDVMSGTLPLTTQTRITGKVVVLKLFKIRVTSYTTCDLIVDISDRSVSQSDCKYKTKL